MTAESDERQGGAVGPTAPKGDKRRFTAEISSIPDKSGGGAVIELDASGFVTVWSNQAEQMYGYEPEEIIGKHVSSLYCGGELEQGRAVHELNAIKTRKVYHVFGWQLRKSGQQFWTYTEMLNLEQGFRLTVVETPHEE